MATAAVEKSGCVTCHENIAILNLAVSVSSPQRETADRNKTAMLFNVTKINFNFKFPFV